MAKETKFGTFGGVFTPSILTILGVIMYLRLPWVVGQAGLHATVGIILVAHVISVFTGWSISSIATDKKVGVGGPYYIVSRSLGLPIGGTLGLALFTGLSFSISLYVIGFSESFLAFLGLEPTPDAIRICGTLTIVVITIVTFISTALAIKTQYLIMALIALSLLSIGLGTPELLPEEPHLDPTPGGESMAVLFGIFFPAVTGFTAGVNMSGDLRDPKRSIPRGTLLAIGTGMAVYLGLALFLAHKVPAKQLIEDPEVLLHVALYPPLVVAGIWGATLSSALGSILGAPRILQAVSADRITPKFFARGYGKSNEPRNALMLAFAIGEAGILVAELDAIARVVSMVFLTTYGFLNLSCAIESWASPDFRPEFRAPKAVSLIGAITCVLVMIQLDMLALLGATAVMALLFLYLKRRQLSLDAGDTWEGIWSSLVRSGLYRLSHVRAQQRNWRPNVLAFSSGSPEARAPMRELATALIGGNGILTDFELVSGDGKTTGLSREAAENEPRMGVFTRRIPTNDVHDAIALTCRYHGFTGLQPNTVLLRWEEHTQNPERLGELVDTISGMDLNLLVYVDGERREPAPRPQIDVWWAPDRGAVALALTLLRFVTRAPAWSRSTIRFLLLSPDPLTGDVLRTTTRRLLRDSRMEATVRVIDAAFEARSYEDWIRQESSQADLIVAGLPDRIDDELVRSQGSLAAIGCSFLLARGGSVFERMLPVGRTARESERPTETAPSAEPEAGTPAILPAVRLPRTPELAHAVSSLLARYELIVEAFFDEGIGKAYARDEDLLRAIRTTLDKHFAMLEKGLASANARRQRNVVNRVQSAFLQECQALLTRFEDEALHDQRQVLEAKTESFLADETVIERGDSATLFPRRDPADFRPHRSDAPHLRRFKRRRRLVAWLRRDRPSYEVPIGALQTYYFDRACQDVLQPTIRDFATDSHRLAVHVGKLVNSSKTSLTLIGAGLGPDQSLADFLAAQKGRSLQQVDDLVEATRERLAQRRHAALLATRKLLQAYTRDVDRLDIRRLVARERRVSRAAESRAERLFEMTRAWFETQSLLVQRAKLGLSISVFQHRLASIAHRARETLALQLKTGALSEYRDLCSSIKDLLAHLEAKDASQKPSFKFTLDFKSRFDPRPVVENLEREATTSIAELPESVETLSDESIQELEEGRTTDLELVTVPVRRLVHFFFEAELIGRLQDELTKIPAVEQRAVGVAHDVVRLISFNAAELEALEEETSTEAYRNQLAPVAKNGLERLETEIAALGELGPNLLQCIDRQLQVVLERTDAYELGSSSARLEQQILRRGKKAVWGAHGIARRGMAGLRDGMVRLLYRRSAGVVFARKLRATATLSGAIVDQVLALVNENSPRPEVLSELPFYYRQLFFGQSAISETFWVPRDEQLARARQAIGNHRRGAQGALVVTGDRASGKTALCQRICARLLDRPSVFRLLPPPTGSIDPSVFKDALATAVGSQGEYSQIFSTLPSRCTLVIDDLELWWERSEDGLQVIETLVNLIERYGDRCLFVLGIGIHAFELINRFRPLSDDALAVIQCDPLPAEALKSVVMLRHGSTGMKFSLGSRTEDELSEWRLARLFSRHFDYSDGNVGVTLRSWISHIEKVRGEALTIRAPETRGRALLDGLRVEWIAMLLQLLLHKQVTIGRMRRITGLPDHELRRDLDTLIRMGLVTESRQRVIEINRFVQHIIADRFRKRGILR